jgi:hypothetical protein
MEAIVSNTNINRNTGKFLNTSCSYTGCLKKNIYNSIANVTVWRVLRKRFHLKVYKLSIVHGVERWIVCTPLSVNVFETLSTKKHLEYHCKALLVTSYVTNETHIEP